MSRIGTIARRSFLIGSAAIAGGVAFGYYKYRETPHNPLLDELGPDEAAINAWVKIDKSGVTLIAPHTDLGQGARSMQALLIADEMDLAWGQFTVSPGVPSAAYYNDAGAEELLPVKSTDEGFVAQLIRTAAGGALKITGLQVTGGSSSVPNSFDKLRMAGAVARETLKAAAAQKSGVAVAQLKTADGAVILPDGKKIPYTELAAIAATLSPVTGVPLRDPKEWKLIGKPTQRLDIVGKSTGTLQYGIDLKIEGMLHAAIRLNPRQGGAMTSFDATAAKAMRGVKQVVPVTGGLAVIADNTWRAFRAAEAVKIEWGPAPYPAKMEEHWAAVAGSFREEQLEERKRNDGDVDKALGDKPFEAEYRAPYLAHAPLEPLCAIVRVTDTRADVWTCSQMPRFHQNNVASITGLPAEKVFLHNQMVGGSFGHRLEDDHLKRATEIAVAMKGTAIKLTYSREEDFAHDFPRQIAIGRIRGVVKDGKVEAFDLKIAMPTVNGSQLSRQPSAPPLGPDAAISAGAWDQPFAIPHFRMSGYRAPALAPISSWRSVGSSSNGFFFNSALDELILSAGGDLLAERIRLCSHEPSRKVLEAVGEMSNWGSKLGPNQGRGIGFTMSFGTAVAEVVEVTNTDRGIKIDKVFVAAEVGRVVDPVNFDNLVKGGVIWGLGHAMNCEITYEDGMAQQTNYHAFEGMRLYQCPEIQVRGLENGTHVRGIGEPPVPPAAPALAGAIFAATGKRLREMPFNKFISFV
jgi:isoquinoline 1-oxidoreductase beta subunit